MKYYEEFDGFREDALLGDTSFPVELYNVNVGASASLSRGDLICGESMSSIFAPAGTANDAEKILMIAAEDFVADSLHAVTSAYSAGKFNREKINVANGDLADFEASLREQNIHLTSLRGE